jgi:hypothetical protein
MSIKFDISMNAFALSLREKSIDPRCEIIFRCNPEDQMQELCVRSIGNGVS